MNKLTDLRYVKDLQVNLKVTFGGPAGQEVMRFLETACGWYESIFDPVNHDIVLLNAGKREVLATIKTLLEQPAETIVAMAKEKENA